MIDQKMLENALALPDLTEAGPRPHAIHLLVNRILDGLVQKGWPVMRVCRGPRVVSASDNYGLLGYDSDDVTLGSTHTRWVDGQTLLRTQMTSLVAGHLPSLAHDRSPGVMTGMALPGMVYRRDVRDRWHCGEPHQMDLWILMEKSMATPKRLDALWQDILGLVCPRLSARASPSPHPYTTNGREVEVETEGHWLEVMECGLIHPLLLARLGISPASHAGLALGMGLDRLVMAAKGVPDIRLLRNADARVRAQMEDLSPWRPVSSQPLACRDLSVVVNAGWSLESLTQKAMESLGREGEWVEALELKGVWDAPDMPAVARERLGMSGGQQNLLLTLQLRHPVDAIDRPVATRMAKTVYAALHEGSTSGYGAL
jgi:phenylalanyl-tRNA synthetase alpha chain